MTVQFLSSAGWLLSPNISTDANGSNFYTIPVNDVTTRIKESLRQLVMFACATLLMAGCGGITKGKAASEAAITRFHQLYDAGKFDSIWKEASSKFSSASTKDKFNASMKESLRKLGKVKSTTTTSLKLSSYNFKTTVVITQETIFEKGKGTETFTFEINGEKAVLSVYKIQSIKLKESEMIET